jgi:hypothetical protein
MWWHGFGQGDTEELEDISRRFKAKTVQDAIFLELEHDIDLRSI